MAIRQRGAGWQADITVKGVRTRETFATEADAKAWEHRAKAAVLAGEPLPRPNSSEGGNAPKAGRTREGEFSKGWRAVAMRTWERHWRGKSNERKSLVNIEQIADLWGDIPVDKIDTDLIDNFIDHCMLKGNGDGTINRKLAIISRVLHFALDRGLINRVPRIERKKEAAGRLRWITPEEEQQLIGLLRLWGKDEHADVVTILIDTGMRPSEVYRMEARDVDLKANTISIWKTKTEHPRTIFMTRRVAEIIKARLGTVTGPTTMLYKHGLFWMNHAWDRARGHMGLGNDPHFVPYVCRHTCASRMIQRGVALPIVMRWLGHKNIQMTMRYAHLAPENLKVAMEALQAAE